MDGATKSYASSDAHAVPEKKTPAGWHKFWQKEKTAAQKRLRKFHKQGNLVVKRYIDERPSGNQVDQTEFRRGDTPSRLNLFHTNVATLQSMLFGSTPKIEVSREHQDPDDDVARVASVLYQRILEADVQSSGDDLATTLRATLQDRLLPGLGIARVRYNCTFKTMSQINPTEEGVGVEEIEVVDHETCTPEYVHWQDFLWGWARTWSELPWVAYRAWLTKEEAEERFGAKKANKLDYQHQLPSGSKNKDAIDDKDQQDNIQKAEIWEFWHKAEKKVFWFSEGADIILDAEDDPLQLDGFYPSPMPLMANLTTTLFVPRADFVIAQDLYNEIDELQSRVSTITRAIKVVGVYDKSAGGSVGRMLKEGVENDLIPVDNWAMFAEKGGLAGVIDWFPVKEVVETLQTLNLVQQEKIEQLYQITGMSDILRGANTDQYTSDGTQQLKAKFGSVRVQSLQDEFARFASDLDALKAEVVSKHFDAETIARQSNAQFMPEADLPLIPQAMGLMKSPEVKWRVNIRPESIAMVDYAQLKQERTEFLNAMATYVQSAQAAAKEIPNSLPVLLELMKWGMAGFKGANYLEGTMDKAIEAAKKAPAQNREGEAQQQAAQQAQMDHQNEMQKIQFKFQSDMQLQQEKARAAMQQEQLDHQNKIQQEQLEHMNEMRKLREEFMADVRLISENLTADLNVERAQSAYAIEEEEIEHANTMLEKSADHSNTMSEKREDAKKSDTGSGNTS